VRVGTALFTDIFLLTVAFPVHVRLPPNCLTYHGSLAPKAIYVNDETALRFRRRPHALITFKCYSTLPNSEFLYECVVLAVLRRIRIDWRKNFREANISSATDRTSIFCNLYLFL
jgi:hypothetical protein